jgi:hypothetical protein
MSDVVLICPLCEEDEDGDLDDPEEFATEPEMVPHLASEHSLLMADLAERAMPPGSRACLFCNDFAADPLHLVAHIRLNHAVNLAHQWAARAVRQ